MLRVFERSLLDELIKGRLSLASSADQNVALIISNLLLEVDGTLVHSHTYAFFLLLVSWNYLLTLCFLCACACVCILQIRLRLTANLTGHQSVSC